jgi:Zn-dependent protease with chaperone function
MAPRKKKAEPAKVPRTKLAGISSRAWEHPSDRTALEAMRRVPGFDVVLRRLLGLVGDRSLRLLTLASAVRVGPEQFPELHTRWLLLCDTLDVAEPPELFVSQHPVLNAGALGVDKPFVVIHSATLQTLTEAEVDFVLGHELGHVVSGHVLYKTMLRLLLRAGFMAFSVPMAAPVVFAVTAALLEWDRKSELSADRAALLATQDKEAALSVQMKLAGGGLHDQMNVAAFIRQAEEYDRSESLLDQAMKVLQIMGRSHPFPVLRLRELKAWIDGGGYDEAVAGAYPRRDEDRGPTVLDDIKASAEQAGASIEQAVEPWRKAMRDWTHQAQGATAEVWEKFRNRGER